MIAPRVVWHDVECGRYTADLAVWTRLAARAGGPVLDVGAGTGRVALHLARGGHDVTALDVDPVLLAALRERAAGAGVAVRTVVADAAGFALPGAAFGLVAVPMQTLQLLPGPSARAGFFASARSVLAPGGLVGVAIVDGLEPFEPGAAMPDPDTGEADGRRFISQPTAVRDVPGGVRIERLRHVFPAGGRRTTEQDVVVLARLSAEELQAEGAAAGLAPETVLDIGPTPEHVGSAVVVLRG